MDVRKLACIAAAGFIGTMVVSASTSSPAYSKPNVNREVVVTGERIDPALQRRVSYKDLNLAFPAAQKTLKGRIIHTASNLCFEINNGIDEFGDCTNYAVRGTRPQVAAAIERAKLRMAGKTVGPDLAISMVIIGH